jgi:predicted lipoprotein with Yx(FWY)xxD motif
MRNPVAAPATVGTLVVMTFFAGGGFGSAAVGEAAPGARPAAALRAGPARAVSAARISTRTVRGLGEVLVNAQGRTLHTFAPDKHSKVTCKSTCAVVWPPAFLAAGQKPLATGQVKQSLLGSDPDRAGKRVVTYNGWPLYTYVTDTRAGEVNGQDLDLDGGEWYVISPAGHRIMTKP